MRRVMNHTKQAWWLSLSASIIGFDEGGTGGAGDGGAGDGGEGAAGAAGSTDGGSGEGAQGGEGAEGANSKDDDTAGLKSALAKERADRKKLEKDLAAFRKAEQTKADAEKSDIQRLTDENSRTTAKAQKLAEGFKNNALETAILQAAATAKFRDPSDALRPEVLSAIGVEQDEDDPTKITIDSAEVTTAIKKLAKDKPHYITVTTANNSGGSAPKSGSTFGGANNGGTIPPAQAALLTKYPALRGRI